MIKKNMSKTIKTIDNITVILKIKYEQKHKNICIKTEILMKNQCKTEIIIIENYNIYRRLIK